jgi:hypothetical protein
VFSGGGEPLPLHLKLLTEGFELAFDRAKLLCLCFRLAQALKQLVVTIKRSFNFIRAGKRVLMSLQPRHSFGFLPFKAFDPILGSGQLTAERSHCLLLCIQFLFLSQLLLVARCLQLHFS